MNEEYSGRDAGTSDRRIDRGGERLSKKVYEAVLTDIVHGTHAEGDRLPTELVLAKRFAVSRPVVREALAQLRDDGLIQVRRGSGSYVLHRPNSAVLRFAPLGSISDIQRCFEFRAAIEPAAAALAAHRRNKADLKKLSDALAELDGAVTSGLVGEEADFAFHMAVAEATGNTFFVTTLSSLEEAAKLAISVNRNLSLLAPQERLALVQREHERVFEEIRDGHPEGAKAAMRQHIEGARRRVFEGEASPNSEVDKLVKLTNL